VCLLPNSGDVYYKNEATGETTWDLPTAPASAVEAALPAGWEAATSRSTGDKYYINIGARPATAPC